MSKAEQYTKGKKGHYQRRLKEARIGDVQAQYDVGLMLANGEGVAKNVAEARSWFESAAKRGHTGAQFLLGVAYASGVGVDRDEWQALRWLFKAHEQGNAKAGPKLARLLEKSPGAVVQNCWRELAEAGLPEAQLAVAQGYQVMAQNADDGIWHEAAHWFERAAAQGLAQAQYALGVMYASGTGVVQDIGLAREYLGAAAQQGMASAEVELAALPSATTSEADAAAPSDTKPARKTQATQSKRLESFAVQSSAENQFHLALLYERGFGVARDPNEALKWYRSAAAQGYAPAQFALAQALHESDPAAASSHCLAAAQQGHADAQVTYAQWLEQGQAIAPDALQSHVWMTRAAEQEHPVALATLAQNLEAGNPALAWQCWERAARAGSPQAQFRLGEAALTGQGMPLDSAVAAQWLLLAAERGHCACASAFGRLVYPGTGGRARLGAGSPTAHREAETAKAHRG